MLMTRAALLVFCAWFCQQPAHGQGDNELQRQVDSLREQLRRKEIDLQVLGAKVTDLEERLAACERGDPTRVPGTAPADQPATPAQDPSGEPPAPKPAPVVPGPSVVPAPPAVAAEGPAASPEAMLQAARDRLRDDFGARATNTDRRVRAAYVKELKGWTAARVRETRHEVAWRVRLLDSATARNGHITATAMVLDSAGREVGTCIAELAGSAARAVRGTPNRGVILALRGLATMEMAIDPDLDDPRPFKHSQFIGPCVEARVVVTQATLGDDITTPLNGAAEPSSPHEPQDPHATP